MRAYLHQRIFTKALFLISIFTFTSLSLAGSFYPDNPNPTLTLGSRCEDPDSIRHPEKIAYCKRDVSSGKKWRIIEEYNDLGYRITSRNRYDFKVDHLVPLCIGGSNKSNNLWPQHKNVYTLTDNIEHLTCELVMEGRITQNTAIELVLRAKLNLNEAPGIERHLRDLTGRD